MRKLLLASLLLFGLGCTVQEPPREVPGLALATVVEKAYYKADDKYVVKIESVDKNLIRARVADPFVNRIILSAYVSKTLYDVVKSGYTVVVAYKYESSFPAKVYIVRPKESDHEL